MGLIEFDSSKWLDAVPAEPCPAKVANPAKVGGSDAGFSDFSTLADQLSPQLIAGLEKLRDMPTPRLKRPEVWPVLVADACRFAHGYWLPTARALGWTAKDLFGWSAEWEGLIAWLAGRRLVLLDDCSAVAADEDRRSVFNRRPVPADARYLWEGWR